METSKQAKALEIIVQGILTADAELMVRYEYNSNPASVRPVLKQIEALIKLYFQEAGLADTADTSVPSDLDKIRISEKMLINLGDNRPETVVNTGELNELISKTTALLDSIRITQPAQPVINVYAQPGETTEELVKRLNDFKAFNDYR